MLGIHQYFWRLIPANPILLRVVETGGKRKRDLLIRCVYLGLLVALVIGALVAGSGESGAGSLSSLAKTSANLFQRMSYLQLGLVALLAPVFTAGAITQEKDSQTYDILLATPLTNGQIVLGSLLSRLFFVIALLVSGIPIFSITQIFGGVAIRSIVLSFGIAAATAFATGALAMAIATFKVGTRRTIFSFYLFIVIYMAGGIVLDQFSRFWVDGPVQVTRAPEPAKDSSDEEMTANYGPGAAPYPGAVPAKTQPKPAPVALVGRAHISWFTGINPFLALRVLFRSPEYAPPAFEDLPPGLQKWPIGWYLSDPAGFYISAMFFFSFVLVMPSIILLRRMAQNTASLKTLLLQRLKITSGDRTRKPRGVWSNPIAWREAKTKASAARATFLRYGFMAAGLIVALYLLIQYASTPAPTRAISSSNYDAQRSRIRIPAEAGKGGNDRYLTVLTYPRPQVTVESHEESEEGTQRIVDIKDMRSPMQLVKYATYGDEPPGENEAYIRDQLDRLPQGGVNVLKSITVRPANDPWLVRKYLLGACAIEFAVILLIVTNAAASTVTREKEDGTLDLLLSSPITSRYYIWGKLRGLVSFVLPLVAVPVGSLLLFLIWDGIQSLQRSDPLFEWTVFPESIILLPAMLVIVCAFAAILGMQMSLRCRTTVTAVMSSVGIVVGVCAAMGWCGFSFLKSGKTMSLIVGSFSPFTLMQMMIDPYSSGSAYRAGADDVAAARITVGICTVVAVSVYVAVVWNMYTGMVKNFDMTIRKQSR